MSDENCNVCGSPLSSLGGEGTALAQHILDRNDPHGTLALVPTIEIGIGAPSSAQGHRRTDLYIDLVAQRVYVANGSGESMEWAPATPPAGVTPVQLTSILAGYVSNASLDARLAGYVPTTGLSGYARTSDLAAYATLSAMQTALQGYVQASRISDYGFVDSAALSATLASYVTQTSLATLLSTSYLTQTSAASTYATKEELSAYLPRTEVSGVLEGCVFRTRGGNGEWPVLNLDTILQSYVQRSELSGYVTPAWLLTSGYVNSTVLASALASYVTGSALSAALSSYLTQTAGDARYLKLEDYAGPADLPTGIMGAVFRSPTSPGVYPERNLDVVLQGYLAKSEAASTYVTRTYLSGLGYVTGSALSAALASYIDSTALSTALSPYLTKTDAASTYVTPAYLAANGYLRSSDGNSFVYRATAGAELNLDTVLASWPAQSITATEAKPPAASAVFTALAQRDASILALQSQVNNLSVTGGQSAVINVITEPAGLQSNTSLIPVDDKAVNTIVMSGSWLTRVSNVLTVAVPDAYQNGTVARDFLVVLDFPSDAGSGQVPVTFAGFVTRAGTAVSKFSYTATGLFSMTGIAYGMKVVYALTELRPGVFAVTRKNLYEV